MKRTTPSAVADVSKLPGVEQYESPWVAARSLTARPFIFQKMVRAADPSAKAGDVVQVYDRHGVLFGRGLYNPKSQIVVRMLTQGAAAVDDEFWRRVLEQAVELRRQLKLAEVADAYRLVHAEGDGLSGLTIERFADVLVFEAFSLGMYQRHGQFVKILAEILGPPDSLDRPDRASATWRTLIRADTRIQTIEGFRVPAAAEGSPTKVTIREHGIRYRVDLATGQKTGFFCDQRDNRRQFASFCADAHVLDLCCYTGGFGLAATILGGAKDVTSVDLDEKAIAVAKDNANINQVRVQHVHADAFAYLRQMIANGRQYDAVVLDPPKLALNRDGIEEALAKYRDLNHLALQVVRPGGLLLTCSCSGLVPAWRFVETVRIAGQRAGRRLQMFQQSGAAADHPVLLNCPESGYLKAIWMRVLRPETA